MANKGGTGYIKRLNAPKYFSIHKKEHKYIIKQNPGRHAQNKSVALTIVLDKLGIASNRSESKKIIKGKLIKVNNKQVNDPKYPVGLNDLIDTGSQLYLIKVNSRGQIAFGEGKNQIYKVIGKYKSKNNTIMLRLHDGSAIKGANDVKVNDSVEISSGKFRTIKLNVGSKCEIIDGVHVGKLGKVSDIREGDMHKQKSVVIEQPNGEKFETLVKNIIVVE